MDILFLLSLYDAENNEVCEFEQLEFHGGNNKGIIFY